MPLGIGKSGRSCFCLPVRHGVILLTFLFGSLLYSLRFNLSIAIVAMVEEDFDNGTNNGTSAGSKSYNSSFDLSNTSSQTCPSLIDPESILQLQKESKNNFSSEGRPEAPKFRWNEKDQGLILGSFFWGYMFSQFPSGIISQKYGAKWVVALGLLFTGILSMALPHAAIMGGRDFVIVVRILQGISEGFTVPALIILLSKWCPPQERARLSALCFAGMPFGTACTMIISGPLITTFGWPAVFYLPGILSIVWFVYWIIYIHSTPDEHPGISPEELNFIRESKQRAMADGKILPPDQPLNFSDVPWRKIACSGPVWAVCISQFFNCWGHNMLKSEGPKYLHSALHFDIHSNGYLSASPYISQCIFVMVVGRASDWLIERKIFTMLTARRFCNSLGQWGSALAFAGIILSGCNRPFAVFCYIMSGMINGAMLSGSIVNIIDIAPNYSGAIEGVINSAANIAGFGAPLFAGFILYSEPSMLGWSMVFLIPVVANVIGNLAFLLGSSVEIQPWDDMRRGDKTNVERGDKKEQAA